MDRISTDDRRPGRPSGQRPHRESSGVRSKAAYKKKKRRPTAVNSAKKSTERDKKDNKKIKITTVNVWNGIKNMWHDMMSVFANKRLGFDKPLLIIVLLLLVVGLIMIYSASYAYAYYEMGDSTYYIQRQILYAAIGVGAMLFVSTIPPEKYKGKFTWGILAFSYVLLVIVLFTPKVNGVTRWIPLGFTTFQPSEIAKSATILWCAYYITTHYKQINTTRYPDEATKLRVNRSKFAKWRYEMLQNFKFAVLPFLVILAPMLVLLLLEPHLSCTVLVVLIIATMMYVGGTKKSYFSGLAILGAIAFYLVIYTDIVPYGQTRIAVWKDPFVDKLGAGWQNIQSLYAISSGGLFGVGLGNSRQKYLYISEPQNDFIFAVVCEELGLIGASLIILLFVAFVWRGLSVSISNPDKFSKFVGIGITSQIGFQALLNVCVVTKIVPNTGISLPFFSYGGTSLLMLLIEIGVLLAISRRSPNKII